MNAIIPSSTQSHSTQYALLSAEQHVHFRGKLRPADVKQRRNVHKNFRNYTFSFRHLRLLVIVFVSITKFNLFSLTKF